MGRLYKGIWFTTHAWGRMQQRDIDRDHIVRMVQRLSNAQSGLVKWREGPYMVVVQFTAPRRVVTVARR